MERVGLGRRLPAALLDGLFLSIVFAVVVVVYSVAGGASLAVKAREHLGIPVTVSSIASDEVWREFERESEQMIRALEQQVREDFTDEQAEFIARVMGETVEGYFVPENLTLERVLALDARVVDKVIDEAFDAVAAADAPGIERQEVEALRAEVKMLVDRFALGQLVPAAIRFVVWLVLLPVIVTLVYGFAEAIWGRTPGKLAMGIVIHSEDEYRPAVPALMLRYAIKYSPLLLVVLTIVTRLPVFAYVAGTAWLVVALGALVMLGPDRRAVHDFLAGTAVYRSEPKSW